MTFFFYDLETSGRSAREQRIMQFAGQRTDMDLNTVGEPVDVKIRLTDDVVPEPEAILLTGITPQQTLQDGMTEAEFCRMFVDEIATPGTIFVGFNTVRFDDEFMRFMLYRNFYDPYEWQWKDNRSKWDLLDVVRMTRALRPEGIKWPMNEDGKPTNRLELITAENGISHENAHDGLNDVLATIAVAKLIKAKQPKLFDYLLSMRDKREVEKLVGTGQPFVYSSGRYDNAYEKTTVAAKLCPHPKKQGVFVFDLRYDPAPYLKMTAQELTKAWEYQAEPDPDNPRLPIKLLQYNRCPAVAPLGVLDDASKKRLRIDLDAVTKNLRSLQASKTFCDTLAEAARIREDEQQKMFGGQNDVDAQLYDGFFQDGDKQAMSVVRAAKPEEITDGIVRFNDHRLAGLLPRYKARNFSAALTGEEREAWEKFRAERLLGGGTESRLAKFFKQLETLANSPNITEDKMYLLEELQLYGQSIIPVGAEE